MTIKLAGAALGLLAILALAGPVHADSSPRIDNGTDYYLSLGDSAAAGTNATGGGVAYTDMGYADQLYATLAQGDPKLELVKLGCPGESTASMRFGSQPPTTVLSCGTPSYYKNVLYSKGTRLDEAVGFLHAHRGKVALVTIDIGANDLQRFDTDGNLVICLFEPGGCATQITAIVANLTAILADLRAAAGPDVPILGMTYYDVFAPLCISDPALAFVCGHVDAGNAALVDTYDAARVPVADVAGAFENDDLPAASRARVRLDLVLRLRRHTPERARLRRDRAGV
jgi:hypothetical protein